MLSSNVAVSRINVTHINAVPTHKKSCIDYGMNNSVNALMKLINALIKFTELMVFICALRCSYVFDLSGKLEGDGLSSSGYHV